MKGFSVPLFAFFFLSTRSPVGKCSGGRDPSSRQLVLPEHGLMRRGPSSFVSSQFLNRSVTYWILFPLPRLTLPSFFFFLCSCYPPTLRLAHGGLVPQWTTLAFIEAETSVSPCTICVHIFTLSHVVIALRRHTECPQHCVKAGVYCESGSPWLLTNYKSEQTHFKGSENSKLGTLIS